MSHPMIERSVTERSDSEFFTGAPTLEGYYFTLSKGDDSGPTVIEVLGSASYVKVKDKRQTRFNLTAGHRRGGQRVDADQTGLRQIVYKSFDTIGNDIPRLSEQVYNLVSRPKSYSRDVNEKIPADRGAAEQNQAVAALLALEFSEPDEEDRFPHSALRSFSEEGGAEIERILAAGAPDWVRELRQQLGR